MNKLTSAPAPSLITGPGRGVSCRALRTFGDAHRRGRGPAHVLGAERAVEELALREQPGLVRVVRLSGIRGLVVVLVTTECADAYIATFRAASKGALALPEIPLINTSPCVD